VNTSTEPRESFDYVVVGSGSGGGPLSVRLAEAGYHVLVLEAGGDHPGNLYSQVPAFNTAATENLELTWNFYVNHYTDPELQRQGPKYLPERHGILYPRFWRVRRLRRPQHADHGRRARERLGRHRRPDGGRVLARGQHAEVLPEAGGLRLRAGNRSGEAAPKVPRALRHRPQPERARLRRLVADEDLRPDDRPEELAAARARRRRRLGILQATRRESAARAREELRPERRASGGGEGRRVRASSADDEEGQALRDRRVSARGASQTAGNPDLPHQCAGRQGPLRGWVRTSRTATR
jgi:hypothetical protein